MCLIMSHMSILTDCMITKNVESKQCLFIVRLLRCCVYFLEDNFLQFSGHRFTYPSIFLGHFNPKPTV